MQHVFVLLFTLCVAFAENPALKEFTNANNLFTSSVYREIVRNENGNFLVSPFSAEAALAFAQSGARGETADEIRTALHLPNDRNRVESALKSLFPQFKSTGLYTLHTANKLYIQDGFRIRDKFKRAASSVYGADSEEIDFSRSSEASTTMNSWIEKQTNNRIRNLIKPGDLDTNTRAVLINALYFKANWSVPFSTYSTQKKIFYATPAKTVEVAMMQHDEEIFKYYECPHLRAQFVELPFQGGEASMVVVLPTERDGLANLERQLDQVFSPQHQFVDQLLNVALPKFKIESAINFRGILENLGVQKAFDQHQADFTGIAGNKNELFISKVAQKAFIEVNEGGVEAAAATFVSIQTESAPIDNPKDFTADHPFIFYIKAKDLVIFAGRVVDPSK